MLVIRQSTCRPALRLLRLEGELDFFSAFQVRAALDQAAAAGDRVLTVDVEHVVLFDGSALGVLEKAWHELRTRGLVVEMINAPSRLRQLVAMVGLEDTFRLDEAARPTLELLEDVAQ